MSHGYGECCWPGCYADSGEAWGYCKQHRQQGKARDAQRHEEEEMRQKARDAGPELLAALVEARKVIASAGVAPVVLPAILGPIDAAIAKAGGK